MSIPSVINVDLADVFAQPGRKYFLHTLAWGDAVEVLEVTDAHVRIATTKFEKKPDGSILPVAKVGTGVRSCNHVLLS